MKWSHYRPSVAQRVGRGIALLFHDRGTRRGWVVSSTPRPHFSPGKDLVPILQEAGWAPRPVWMGGKSRPHRDSIPGRPARSSVAILTEQPGPPIIYIWCKMLSIDLRSLSNGKFKSFIKEEHQCWKRFYSSDIQRTHKISFPVTPLYSFLMVVVALLLLWKLPCKSKNIHVLASVIQQCLSLLFQQ